MHATQRHFFPIHSDQSLCRRWYICDGQCFSLEPGEEDCPECTKELDRLPPVLKRPPQAG